MSNNQLQTHPRNAWSTADELDFIGGLGSYTSTGSSIGRDTLLKRYRAALAKRVEWGKADRVCVLQALDKLL